MALLTTILLWILRILLILVLILLYLLLVPWGLRGRFQTEDEKNCDFQIHSFLHFFHLEASYGKKNAEGLDWGIYLFWGRLKLYPRAEKAKKGKGSRFKKSETEASQMYAAEKTRQEAPGAQEETLTKAEHSNSFKAEAAPSGKKKRKSKRSEKSGKEILSIIKKIFSEPGRTGVQKILTAAGGLIRRMGLHFHKTEIAFGFDSPDYTGITVGILSQFPFVYEPGIRISPDFASNRIYFRGHGALKGHIIIGDVLLTVLRLFMNKEVRMIFNSIGGKSK